MVDKGLGYTEFENWPGIRILAKGTPTRKAN